MSTVLDKAPRAPSRWHRLFSGIGLIRESWIGTAGLIILLFWVAMAVLAPILPLYDPNAQIVPMQPIMATAADGSGDLLARHRFQGTGHSLAHHLGLAARAVLGLARDLRRLYRRYGHGGGRRLSRRLVGRGDLVLRQCPALLPGDGALHHHHHQARPLALQHRDRRHLRLRARHHAHRARADPRHTNAGLRVRRADPAARARSTSCWWSFCPTPAAR